MPSDKPVALVTGSATGVGRACAVRFAQRGYHVVINYSRSQAEAEEARREIEDLGADCLLVRCDVSQRTEVLAMMKRVADRWDRLDVLVNNAATTYFVSEEDLDDLTEEMWDRILAVNAKGTFFCVQAAAGLLRAGAGGAVVNVSSVAGMTGRGSSIAYSASKAAVNAMTKSLARALAPKVRVNAVLPGPIDSRWIRDGDNDWDLASMTADYPIPQPSQPDDIADGIIFLATGTRMTTGQLLVIDGGQTL